jgi:hypothetical protein
MAETFSVGTRIALAWMRPAQLRQQALNATRQAGRHRDDRLHGGTGAAQIVVVITIDQRLVVHHGMQRGQQRLLDADFAVEQIEDRHNRIGRTGGGGNQALAAVQRVFIDPGHDGRVDILAAVAGVREQQARATGGKKTAQFVASTVDARAFDQQVDATPINFLRRFSMADPDRLAVDQQLPVSEADFARKAAMR